MTAKMCSMSPPGALRWVWRSFRSRLVAAQWCRTHQSLRPANNDWEHVWVSYIWGFRNFLNGFQLSLYGMFLKAVLYCFIASTSGIADALLLRNDHGKHGQSGKSYWTHTEFRASLWVNFCFETRVKMWDTATLTDGDTRWPSTWSSPCRLTRLP